MDLKDLFSPIKLAAIGAGAYAGHAKFGKKHGHKATAGGAFAGLLAGILVEKLVAPKQVAPQVAAAQQPQQVRQGSGQGEYVDLDGTDPLNDFVPPPPPNANPAQRAEYEAAQAAFENLGSLSGADGLGSLSGSPGFDADTIDYDEILGSSGGSDFN